MRKILLHIGSYKTGTTAIQNTLYQNRNQLNRQGFFYPGDELNHHKLFFASKLAENDWPREYRGRNRQIIKSEVTQFFSNLERDFKSQHSNYIISTEYLFIDEKKGIKQVINYLQNFFDEIEIYLFVRTPVEYYTSFQQQMIKGRSYITSPKSFHYPFQRVVNAWSEFCDVNVLEHNSQKNSSRIICDHMGINYDELFQPEERINSSISIEKMILLEKIQRNFYREAEDTLKPHLYTIIRHINAPFTSKPELKQWVKSVIQLNHRDDNEWLKDEYGINFLRDYSENIIPPAYSSFEDEKVMVRDVFRVEDEEPVEKYEALVIDVLLKQLMQIQLANR